MDCLLPRLGRRSTPLPRSAGDGAGAESMRATKTLCDMRRRWRAEQVAGRRRDGPIRPGRGRGSKRRGTALGESAGARGRAVAVAGEASGLEASPRTEFARACSLGSTVRANRRPRATTSATAVAAMPAPGRATVGPQHRVRTSPSATVPNKWKPRDLRPASRRHCSWASFGSRRIGKPNEDRGDPPICLPPGRAYLVLEVASGLIGRSKKDAGQAAGVMIGPPRPSCSRASERGTFLPPRRRGSVI